MYLVHNCESCMFISLMNCKCHMFWKNILTFLSPTSFLSIAIPPASRHGLKLVINMVNHFLYLHPFRAFCNTYIFLFVCMRVLHTELNLTFIANSHFKITAKTLLKEINHKSWNHAQYLQTRVHPFLFSCTLSTSYNHVISNSRFVP